MNELPEMEMVIRETAFPSSCLRCTKPIEHKVFHTAFKTEGEDVERYHEEIPVVNVPLCEDCRKFVIEHQKSEQSDQKIPNAFMELSKEVKEKITGILAGKGDY